MQSEQSWLETCGTQDWFCFSQSLFEGLYGSPKWPWIKHIISSPQQCFVSVLLKHSLLYVYTCTQAVYINGNKRDQFQECPWRAGLALPRSRSWPWFCLLIKGKRRPTKTLKNTVNWEIQYRIQCPCVKADVSASKSKCCCWFSSLLQFITTRTRSRNRPTWQQTRGSCSLRVHEHVFSSLLLHTYYSHSLTNPCLFSSWKL